MEAALSPCVQASLRSCLRPRLSRSPPACPRTVRLRRCRSLQASSPRRVQDLESKAAGEGARSTRAAGDASLLPAPTALALPARLPANCPASSLSLLAGQFARKSSRPRVKGSGRGRTLHTCCRRRFAPACAHGSRAPRPLTHELSGFVASLLAGQFAREQKQGQRQKQDQRQRARACAPRVPLLSLQPAGGEVLFAVAGGQAVDGACRIPRHHHMAEEIALQEVVP
jgi:hypothetical protein